MYCIDEVVFAVTVLLILFGYGDKFFVDVDCVSGITFNGEEGDVECGAHDGMLFIVGGGWIHFLIEKTNP